VGVLIHGLKWDAVSVEFMGDSERCKQDNSAISGPFSPTIYADRLHAFRG
jgi:hypothetical protein